MPHSKSLTLYDIEDHLVALHDSLEALPPDEQEQRLSCLDDIGKATEMARDKRDSVARFIRYLSAMEKAQAEEIAYLRKRKEAIENTRRRISEYVVSLIKEHAPEAKEGTSRKLEGNVRVLRMQRNPRSVKVTDEAQVPDRFKRVTVVMNWAAWKGMVERAGIKEVSVERADMEVMKSWIAAELEVDNPVPGAEWEPESHHLRVD